MLLCGIHRFVYMPMRSEREIQQAATIKIPPATGVRYLAYHYIPRGGDKAYTNFYFISSPYERCSFIKIKAGEYQVRRTMTARELLDNIVAGKVKQ